MGNEMGNTNTSGLREEDNASPEAQGKSDQEPVRANDVQGEKYAILKIGGKDYHQKEVGSASDDPEGSGYNISNCQTTKGTGQEDEVNPPVESPKAEKKYNEEGGEDRDVQPPPDCLPEELESENVLEIRNDQIDTQSFFRKEEDVLNSTLVATSSAPGPESEDSTKPMFDQHELVHADQSKRKRTNEDVLGSSVESSGKENGHMLDMGTKGDDLFVKEMESQEYGMPGEETLEIEVGNEDGNSLSKITIVSTDLPSDVEEKNDGELASKINCNGTNSMESLLEANLVAYSANSRLEVSPPEDKCMVLTEETKLIRKQYESEENRHDHHEETGSQTDDSLMRPNGDNTEMESFLITDPDIGSNRICHIEEVTVVEESEEHNEASEHHEGSAEKIVMDPNVENFAADSAIANGKRNQGKSGDFRPEAFIAHDAASNWNCQAEGANVVEELDKQNEASEEQSETTEGKILLVPELLVTAAESSIVNGENIDEISGDCEPEACERKVKVLPELVAVTSELPLAIGTDNEEESKNCKAEEQDPAEKQILEINETLEAPFATEQDKDERNNEAFESQPLPVVAEEHLPCAPASLIQSEDNQQRAVTKSEDAQGSIESTFGLTPESSCEFFVSTASTFRATSFPTMTCLTAVELAIQKSREEVLPQLTAGTKMETQTNSSASTNHSSAQPKKAETSSIETQKNAVRLSTEPIPYDLIQAEMQTSPSSTAESRVSAVQLGIKPSQQELPYYDMAVPDMRTEVKSSASLNQSSEQWEKVETSAFARAGHEPQQSVGRFSTESTPDILNVHPEMLKSPSFNLDLQIDARSEESDRTPLLYQDKNTIESLSSQSEISLGNSLPLTQYGQESQKYQEMPVEEKVITLVRSDSDKSRTAFLGFLKEDEEAHHLLVKPKKQENHSAAKKASKDPWNSSSTKRVKPMPSKSKEKQHKRRSSLFSNCMCCTTVFN